MNINFSFGLGALLNVHVVGEIRSGLPELTKKAVEKQLAPGDKTMEEAERAHWRETLRREQERSELLRNAYYELGDEYRALVWPEPVCKGAGLAKEGTPDGTGYVTVRKVGEGGTANGSAGNLPREGTHEVVARSNESERPTKNPIDEGIENILAYDVKTRDSHEDGTGDF